MKDLVEIKFLIIHQLHQMFILKIILLLHETVTYPNLDMNPMAILLPETLTSLKTEKL